MSLALPVKLSLITVPLPGSSTVFAQREPWQKTAPKVEIKAKILIAAPEERSIDQPRH
jgi:hypothetical protein